MKALSFDRTERVALAAIILGGGVLLGLIGPFGDYVRLGTLVRIGLWSAYCVVGAVFFIGGLKAARAMSPRFQTLPAWAQIASTSAVAAFPMFVAVEAIGLALGRSLPGDVATVAVSLLEIGGLGVLGVGAFHLLTVRGAAEPAQTAASDAPRSASAGENRTPAELRAELGPDFGDAILCVKAEGHYARVYGAVGDRLIGLTFSRTVALLEDMDGAVVHRSWWVARDAVASKRGRGAALALVLNNDLKIPVARRRVKDLRARDWSV